MLFWIEEDGQMEVGCRTGREQTREDVTSAASQKSEKIIRKFIRITTELESRNSIR
jgi:hypothetical protein